MTIIGLEEIRATVKYLDSFSEEELTDAGSYCPPCLWLNDYSPRAQTPEGFCRVVQHVGGGATSVSYVGTLPKELLEEARKIVRASKQVQCQ